MIKSVDEAPIWKPTLPPSMRTVPGADQPAPLVFRRDRYPFPYFPPTTNAAVLRSGTITMQWAFSSQERAGPQETADRLLAAARRHRQSHAASLDVHHTVAGRRTLSRRACVICVRGLDLSENPACRARAAGSNHRISRSRTFGRHGFGRNTSHPARSACSRSAGHAHAVSTTTGVCLVRALWRRRETGARA